MDTGLPVKLDTATRAEAGSEPSRLPTLTGMRFIAALSVFLFHITYLAPFQDASVASGYGRVVGQGGWTGVSFFFVLSGFVLAWSARPTDTAPQFLRRRLVKIFPNHLTIYVLVALPVVAAMPAGGWKLLPGLLLVQAWFPQADITSGANPVAWSLSCELFFYLLFPLLHRAVARIRPSLLWCWVAGVTALVCVVPLIARFVVPASPSAPSAPGVPAYEFWFVYIFPPVRLLEFVLGILMARIVLTGRWIRLPLLPATGIVVAAYALAPEVPLLFQIVAVTLVPIALLIPAAAAVDIEGRWSPLRNRVMVWLGNVSFAFYLWHLMVLAFGRFGIGIDKTFSGTAVTGLALIALGIVLGLAWLTYTFVERPMVRAWARARTRAPKPVPRVA